MENIFVEFLPPWVETGLQPAFYDKESGTVLQQTARMYDRVNMLIRMFNKLSKQTKETVEDYIEKFNELYNYVHDYFDNLDVQEEINNKLDAMVEAGTLQEIITTYIQANVAWTFDTVADMKLATNLVAGSYARTLGYYTLNDGGGAIYKISDSGTANEMDVIAVDSLYANLCEPIMTTPQMFGIKGDGLTDYTSNINYYLNYCAEHNVKAYFPDGTYIINSRIIKIYLKDNKNLTIEGNYKATILKRKNNSLGETKWDRLFEFTTDENNVENAGDITIKNLMIDSNRRGQSNATEGYEHEMSADLAFYGTEDSHISNVYIDNLYCIDGVADHIDFTGSTSNYVENAYINNVRCEQRQGTRFDIDFPGYCLGNIFITNCTGKRLHFEYNTDPDGYSKAFINNCEFNECAIEGKVELLINNLKINNWLVLAKCIGLINNSLINLDGTTDRSYIYACKITMSNCEFDSHYSTRYSTDTNPTDSTFLFVRNTSTVVFDNCTFKYVDTPIASFTDGRNYMLMSSAESTGNGNNITLNSCTFYGANIYAIFCYAETTFNITDTDLTNTNNLSLKTVTNHTDLVVNLNNVKFNPNKYFCKINGNGATIKGDNLKCSATSFYIDASGTNFGNTTLDLHRIIYVTSPLDTTYLTSLLKTSTSNLNLVKNDEFVLNSEHNPHKWIVKSSISKRVSGVTDSIVNKVDEIFNVISDNCRGATTDRPTCYLSNGFEFYDSTLGTPIWYNGTGWVDATGTSV